MAALIHWPAMTPLNDEIVTTPPRASASVVLLRDGNDGLEVLLLRRHGASDVLGGVYVFPGGKLDPDDSAQPVLQRLDAPLDLLHRRLGESVLQAADAASFFVAACRETFEEAGVLLARSAGSAPVGQALECARGGARFGDVLTQLDLQLAVDRMMPWSRWITPKVPSMMRKRFDTRFFVAALPEGQEACHDDHEAVESLWIGPRHALQRYWNREIVLAPAQIMSLAHLAHHRRVDSVLDEAASRPPPCIEPEPFQHEGVRVIAYPGDERHSVPGRVMPGPTRLHHRNERFEPPSGEFESMFNPI